MKLSDFEIGRECRTFVAEKLLKVQITALSPLPSVSPNIEGARDDDDGHVEGGFDLDNDDEDYNDNTMIIKNHFNGSLDLSIFVLICSTIDIRHPSVSPQIQWKPRSSIFPI